MHRRTKREKSQCGRTTSVDARFGRQRVHDTRLQINEYDAATYQYLVPVRPFLTQNQQPLLRRAVK